MTDDELDRPTFTQLLDWLEGRLDPAEGSRVADRVASGDQRTRADVAWIRSFLESAQGMPLHRPSAKASRQIQDAVQERLRPWAPSSYDDATLVLDSRSQLATGTRRARGDEGPIHLAYDLRPGRLLVDVVAIDETNLLVRGSVLDGPDPDRVVLTSGRTVRSSARCSAGEFQVVDVANDVDELWVSDGTTWLRAEIDLLGDGTAGHSW